jgi:hypothetical protein
VPGEIREPEKRNILLAVLPTGDNLALPLCRLTKGGVRRQIHIEEYSERRISGGMITALSLPPRAGVYPVDLLPAPRTRDDEIHLTYSLRMLRDLPDLRDSSFSFPLPCFPDNSRSNSRTLGESGTGGTCGLLGSSGSRFTMEVHPFPMKSTLDLIPAQTIRT